jgi:polyribonucleotide nucleotidyltransferase
MSDAVRVSGPINAAGLEMTLECGKLAQLADGAVKVTVGETTLLSTVCTSKPREGIDFFPLTVDVEERMYAAGKIPGGFFKREGRATERATLTARMIDRPIRPLWPKGFRNEVQVICTVLSADLVTPHDILCINGASAALMISPLPFLGPIGAVRIGQLEGELVINPTLEQLDASTLDLIVVGTSEGLTMVEAGGDQVPEDTILEALELAHVEIRKICAVLEELRSQVGKPKWVDVDLSAELDAEHGETVRAAIAEHGLREAGSAVDALVEELAPAVSMASTEGDMTKRAQIRARLGLLGRLQRRPPSRKHPQSLLL